MRRLKAFRAWTSVIAFTLLFPGAHVALGGDEPQGGVKPPAGSAAVDLDLLLKALQHLRGDPAFGGVEIPTGDALVRVLMSDLPSERREEIARGIVGGRMMGALVQDVGGAIEAQVLLFRRSEDASAFTAARRAASKAEDARRDPDPGKRRVLEASYEEGAGPQGRFPGFTVRKRSTRFEHTHRTVTTVAQLRAVVVVLHVDNLEDISRPALDDALERVESALLEPQRARRAPKPGPVFLHSLGPTTTVRAVGGNGLSIPRFTLQVQWEKDPGSYRTWGGQAEDGIAVIRVPHVPSTVDVWAARSAEDRPLPWGPASTTLAAGSTEVEIKLHEGLALSGVVSEPGGGPLEGMQVVAYSTEGARGIPSKLLPPGGLGRLQGPGEAHAMVRTSATGGFSLVGLGPSRYRVTIASEGEWFTVHDVEVDSGTDTVELVVQRALAVDVRVLGPDDRPVVGARVSAFPVGKGETSFGFIADLAFEADAMGVAHLRRLRSGGNYRLTVSPPRSRPEVSTEVVENWSPSATTVRLPNSR